MDSLNKNFIWLEEAVSEFAKQLSGTLVTTLETRPCELELTLNHRELRGSLKVAEQVFAIRAFFSSQTKAVYGVLLTPSSGIPVALLRITPKEEGVLLELEMLDFELVKEKARGLHFQHALSDLIT